MADAGVGRRLHDDHVRLDALYERLLDAYRGGDWDDVRVVWTEFESGLRAHLDEEEAVVLGPMRAAHPAEVEALLAEHAELRRRIAELGVGVDLHLVDDDVASALIATLRAHAAREDRLAYAWADRELGAPAAAAPPPPR